MYVNGCNGANLSCNPGSILMFRSSISFLLRRGDDGHNIYSRELPLLQILRLIKRLGIQDKLER